MVVLGRVVGAGDHGALSPRLTTTGLDVDAGAGDVPELGEGAGELCQKTSVRRGQLVKHPSLKQT